MTAAWLKDPPRKERRVGCASAFALSLTFQCEEEGFAQHGSCATPESIPSLCQNRTGVSDRLCCRADVSETLDHRVLNTHRVIGRRTRQSDSIPKLLHLHTGTRFFRFRVGLTPGPILLRQAGPARDPYSRPVRPRIDHAYSYLFGGLKTKLVGNSTCGNSESAITDTHHQRRYSAGSSRTRSSRQW